MFLGQDLENFILKLKVVRVILLSTELMTNYSYSLVKVFILSILSLNFLNLLTRHLWKLSNKSFV